MSRDIIIDRVIQKFKGRSDVGFKKYGVTLKDDDQPGVTLKDDDQPLDTWLTHIQEELMDAVNYIEKVKDVLYMSRTISDYQEDTNFTDKEIEAINKASAEYYPEFYKPE